MIDWTRFFEMFTLGAAGALSLEIIKVYELRGKLHFKKYHTVLRSALFWLVAILFVAVSGFISWAFNEGNPNVTPWQLIISGMGASATAKKFSEAFAANTRIDAGDSDVELRDLFS